MVFHKHNEHMLCPKFVLAYRSAISLKCSNFFTLFLNCNNIGTFPFQRDLLFHTACHSENNRTCRDHLHAAAIQQDNCVYVYESAQTLSTGPLLTVEWFQRPNTPHLTCIYENTGRMKMIFVGLQNNVLYSMNTSKYATHWEQGDMYFIAQRFTSSFFRLRAHFECNCTWSCLRLRTDNSNINRWRILSHVRGIVLQCQCPSVNLVMSKL